MILCRKCYELERGIVTYYKNAMLLVTPEIFCLSEVSGSQLHIVIGLSVNCVKKIKY